MRTRNTTQKRVIGAASILLIAAGLPLAIGTPLASAQDALGDGRALDASLRVGSGGRNDPGRNFAREFAFRNAIVTGNVPGGMAFRGELGYSAADDFRGDLGSTDFFDFERDSFYSSLATRNLGGIDPLRSSLSWSIAGQRDGVFGDLIVSRPGAGATAGQALDRQREGVPNIDVFSSIQGAMRSPSSMMLEAELRPQLLGYSQDDRSGQVNMLTASSLLGVRSLPPVSPVFGRRSIAEEDARLEFMALPPVDPLLRQTEEPQTQEEVFRPTQVMPERATDVARDTMDVSTYNRLVASLRAESNAVRATRAGEAVLIPESERTERPERVTPEDRTDPFAPPTAPEDPFAQTDDPDAEELDPRDVDYFDRSIERLRSALRLPDLPMPRPAPMPRSDEDGVQRRTVSTLDLVDELVRDLISTNLPIIETLDPPPTSSATFRNHIRSGTEHLGAGEWFAAEERFTAALSIEPGDPSAAIGRVNAQLGGGMFLSAALNLRDLLRAYPELLAARFDASLLPDEDRSNRIRAQLRQRAETNRPLARDAGLLLAYLGHQTGTKQDIIDGFAIIERVEEALEINPDPVHIAAKAAWMRISDDAQPTRPTETPAP
ncbi:MAG: hypothetical protein EA380_11225 [Phycisphaeraceae bacterium]|nr:MAG: hypothetical protein EA380_11225 [Phycisphaeraceae bacterium]